MQIPDKIKILWKEYEVQRKSRDGDLISDGDALIVLMQRSGF